METVQISLKSQALEIECLRTEGGGSHEALYVALSADPSSGCAVVPYGAWAEGSTVFLPFRANHVYLFLLTPDGISQKMRSWENTQWGELTEASLPVQIRGDRLQVRIPVPETRLKLVTYTKALEENHGWGRMLPTGEHSGGYGDQTLRSYQQLDPATGEILTRSRLPASRARIYQLFVRLFGNTQAHCIPNGTMAQNGVGKFADINDAALAQLQQMGFTHIWLTGILRQATATEHPGLPADDPDLLKGLAGSPYAIKDYFDLCPDYALDPASRLEEFRALLSRIHSHGMAAIIDFVPNHVARSYQSTIRPNLSFGAHDDPAKFCIPENNFFHLPGQPLKLPTWKDGQAISPTCRILGTCDGVFPGETTGSRVTGNNVASASPSLNDWYETVKLNYGFDFTTGWRAYPHGSQNSGPIPDTWAKMDQVLAYWQEVGVDGFRCDMAHMVPPEFWAWAIGQAHARKDDVFFFGEAYNNDPMRVVGGNPLLAALDDRNVMIDLLSAGFDAVYDDPSYKALKALYDGQGWANDIDAAHGPEFIFQNSLRYAENHDEVRLAGRHQWANIGPDVGKPVAAILYGLSGGPILLYNGQEVGEPADGAEGFGGDDARTTIFDYWSMPEMTKWVHHYDGAHLSAPQKQLVAYYQRLLLLTGQPAFAHGGFFPLNPHNLYNDRFGRLDGDSVSGHWLYAYLRSSAAADRRHSFLVLVNLHPRQPMHWPLIHLPADALRFLGLPADGEIPLVERLATNGQLTAKLSLHGEGSLVLEQIPALTAFYFDLNPSQDV